MKVYLRHSAASHHMEHVLCNNKYQPDMIRNYHQTCTPLWTSLTTCKQQI